MSGIGVDSLNRTASNPAPDLAHKNGALLRLGDNLHSYDGSQAEYMRMSSQCCRATLADETTGDTRF